jgi:hypothetical protein
MRPGHSERPIFRPFIIYLYSYHTQIVQGLGLKGADTQFKAPMEKQAWGVKGLFYLGAEDTNFQSFS